MSSASMVSEPRVLAGLHHLVARFRDAGCLGRTLSPVRSWLTLDPVRVAQFLFSSSRSRGQLWFIALHVWVWTLVLLGVSGVDVWVSVLVALAGSLVFLKPLLRAGAASFLSDRVIAGASSPVASTRVWALEVLARGFAAAPLRSRAAWRLDARLAAAATADSGTRAVRDLLVKASIEHALERPFAYDPDRCDVFAAFLTRFALAPSCAAALAIVDELSSGSEGLLLLLDDLQVLATALGDDADTARLALALAPGWKGSLPDLAEAARALQKV